MLFKVLSTFKDAPEKEFFVVNPGADAIHEFSILTTRQMFFVCLVADRDPDSPLRTLPETVRRQKAAEIAGYKFEGGRLDKNGRNAVDKKVPNIEKAIAKFTEIQYDSDQASLDAIEAQIQEANMMMKMDKMEATRKEIVKVKQDGSSTKESFIDVELAFKLAEQAVKLGSRLVELKETRQNLLLLIQNKNGETPLNDIVTFTSNDISEEDFSNTETSTIDMVMAKQRNQQS